MLKNIFYLQEQGKRKNIEDHIFPEPGTATKKDRVFIVCDGVGGLSMGEEASRIVCENIARSLRSGIDVNTSQIKAAVSVAVATMHVYGGIREQAHQMSTTLTLAVFSDDGIWTAWCGDSRIYHIRDGSILWKSKDHSLVQQLVDSGDITEEEAMHHPQKNIILRSLSAASDVPKVDIHFISDSKPDDYILLCTDGILEQIGAAELKEILDPSNTVSDKRGLFLRYCEGKTSDNYSMYLLQLGTGFGGGASKILKYVVLFFCHFIICRHF
nr:protein phosphatase 2C domain-containing protein [Pedobacter sp. ASV19]